jgi:hypothetical protein
MGGTSPIKCIGQQGATPALGDLDNDGQPELVMGQYLWDDDPTFKGIPCRYFHMVGRQFEEVVGSANPLQNFRCSRPALVDLNGHGKLDVVDYQRYFRNVGTRDKPAFELDLDADPSVYGLKNPTFGDLTGDGLPDAISWDGGTGIIYSRNVGNKTFPVFQQEPGFVSVMVPTSTTQRLSLSVMPTLGDVDSDGRLDLLLGSTDGPVFFYRNIGSKIAPQFVAMTGTDNPFDGMTTASDSRKGGGSSPAFVDSGFGSADLFIGGFDPMFQYGTLVQYYQNSPQYAAPQFTEVADAVSPFENVKYPKPVPMGFGIGGSIPTFCDIDGDGLQDVLLSYRPCPSNGEWKVRYYHNVGTADTPVFKLETPVWLGWFWKAGAGTLACGDVNGDGFDDIILFRFTEGQGGAP